MKSLHILTNIFQARDSQNSVCVTSESQRKLIMHLPVKFHCNRKLLQLTATCVHNKLNGTENKQFGKGYSKKANQEILQLCVEKVTACAINCA